MREHCAICGSEIPQGSGVIPHGYNAILCNRCGAFLWKCETCAIRASCAINSYNGDKPKIVNQTIRQGNVTMTKQVINPELVNEFCTVCKCGNCASSENCEKYELLRNDSEFIREEDTNNEQC